MRTSQQRDPFATLGVPPWATANEVKRAYRAKAKRFHPDLDPSPKAAERFREVHAAYKWITEGPVKQPKASERPAPRPRPNTAPTCEPDRHIAPWLFRGLHLAGLLFGIGCVSGTICCYLFLGLSQWALLLMVPGLLLIPDSWAGLVMRDRP
ncbi:MAG: J domain-containing protein [Flavobacteriales bacterium]|nr:MAG: J domain-containing protein [Flavobacteriales bacterium]